MKLLKKLICLLFPDSKELDPDQSWDTNIAPEFFNDEKIDKEALKFVFSQAEKKLEDSIKAFNGTTNKSISIITLGTGLLIAQLSYFFVNNNIHGQFNPKLATVLLSSLLTFGVLHKIMFNILPTSYHAIGSSPSRLFNSVFFNDQTKDRVLVYLYVNEIEIYQVKISNNFEINRTRLARIRDSIALLMFLPFVDLALYWVLNVVVSLL